MILSLAQIRSITCGALRVAQDDEGRIVFSRFTPGQVAAYDPAKNITTQVPATAGIRLELDTDSRHLSFAYWASSASARRQYYFDVLVDGELYEHVGEENVKASCGTLRLELPAGEHRVAVYFPNLFSVRIKNVTLDDGAALRPVEKPLRMLCYGDSITQGYDALYPSRSYVNRIADRLNAHVTNFGIGGEVFRPELVTRELDFDPDIVTVAYGSNDFTKKPDRQRMERDAYAFHESVRAAYPRARIFAITPIWRYDGERETPVGRFEDAIAIARDAALSQPRVVVVNGMELTPHEASAYYDGLHPTDDGFAYYAEGLYAAMRPYLQDLKKF